MDLEVRQLDGLIHEMLGNQVKWYLYPFGLSVPQYTEGFSETELNDLKIYFLIHNN